MSEVEKSVAEQLKELLDAAVAEKANAADLEGLVKTEALEEKADKADLEGVVKSEQLDEVKSATASIVAEAVEAAKAEVREEMEAKMAVAPAVHTSPKAGIKPGDFMKHVQEDGTESMRKSIVLSKAAVDNNGAAATEQVDGGREDFAPTWRKLELLNPFRPYVTTMQASGGVITLPEVDGIFFTREGAAGHADNSRFAADSNVTDDSSKGSPNRSIRGAFQARNNQGQLGSTQIVIQNFVSQSSFSKPALEDVPALREQIAAMIVEAYAKAQAVNCYNLINTNAASFGEGGVDINGTGLTDATIVENMANLIEEVQVQYRVGGRFHVSSSTLSLLNQARASSSVPLDFDPVTQVTRFLGYEVVLNGYLDSLEAAAPSGETTVGAIFGNMDRALVLAERRNLVIDEYPQAAPGYNTYFADGRFNHGLWDTDGMACMFDTTA